MNQVDFFEIGTPDGESSKAFYGDLFGWGFSEPSPANYRMIDNGVGGLWDTSGMGGSGWAIFYVHVEDVKQAVQKAQELGATVAIPFTDGGGIQFAHLVDPQGNRFGVWKPNR